MSLFGGLSTPSWISPEDADKVSWQTSRQFGEIFNAAKDRATQNALNAPMRAAQIAEADASVKATQLGIIQKQGLIDAGVDAKAGEAKLAQVAAQISSEPGGWLKPENEARPWEVATQHPGLLNSAVFKRTIDLFGAAAKADAGRIAAEDKATRFEEQNKTLLAIQAMKGNSNEKVAAIKGDASRDVADTRADATTDAAGIRADSSAANRQNRVLIESMKDQASMARLKQRLDAHGDTAGLSKDQAQAYHAALHNAFTFSAQNNQSPEESAASVNAVMKRFGVAMPGETSAPSSAGKPGDPLNLFGPK